MEQAALWEAFKEHGCERAREALIVAHLRYVGPTVTRTVPNVPTALEREDLVSEAMLAVIKAIDRYDPAKGVRSSTWVITSIRFHLHEYLRQDDWVPRSVREAERRGEVVPLSVVSLEATGLAQGHEDEDVSPLHGSLIDPSPPPLAQILEHWEMRTALTLLDWLPRSERDVMRRYYREGENIDRIAGALQRSESRVQQILTSGRRRLQALVSRHGGLIGAP